MKEIVQEYAKYLDSVIAELKPTFTGNARTNPDGLAALSRSYNNKAKAKSDEILSKNNNDFDLKFQLLEQQAQKHGNLVTSFL